MVQYNYSNKKLLSTNYRILIVNSGHHFEKWPKKLCPHFSEVYGVHFFFLTPLDDKTTKKPNLVVNGHRTFDFYSTIYIKLIPEFNQVIRF